MEIEDIALTPYRVGKIDDKYLITNDFGSWCFLSSEEFKSLERRDFDENLVSKLKKNLIMFNKKNFRNLIKQFYSQNLFLFQGPSLHIIVPTLRCNHKCVYCQASSSQNVTMDKKTAIKVLDFIFKSPSRMITIEFQGGEPLLNFDIVKFITENAVSLNNQYEKKNLRITLVSNLTLLDDEKLDFLVKNGVTICTSLDGPKNVHDKNRKYTDGRGTYDDVTKKIKYLQENNVSLNALTTITKYSLPYWKEIVDEYVKWGFETIHLRFLNKLGIAKENWDKIGYSAEEFINFWKKAMNYIIELNENGVNIKERMATIMLTKILHKKDPGYTELMSPCGAGRTQLLYNYNGDIYTCDEGRMLGEDLFKIGNVNKNNYSDIFRNENLIGVCHASLLDNYCSTCVFKPFCGTCPVMNYVEQGTLIPKIHETMRCKIYKAQFTYIFRKLLKEKTRSIFDRWFWR